MLEEEGGGGGGRFIYENGYILTLNNSQSKTVTHEAKKKKSDLYIFSKLLPGDSLKATEKEKPKKAQQSQSHASEEMSSGRLSTQIPGAEDRKGERKNSWNLKRKPSEALLSTDRHASGLIPHKAMERTSWSNSQSSNQAGNSLSSHRPEWKKLVIHGTWVDSSEVYCQSSAAKLALKAAVDPPK